MMNTPHPTPTVLASNGEYYTVDITPEEALQSTGAGKHVQVPKHAQGQNWFHLDIHGDVMDWYIRVVTIGGLPICIHPLFVLLWIIVTVQGLRYELIGAAYCCLVYGPFLWVTLLLHEYGQVWIARKLGHSVERILLWPLGGLSVPFNNGAPILDSLKIASMSLAVYLVMFIIYSVVLAISGVSGWFVFAPVNAWGFVNLLRSLHLGLFILSIILWCSPIDGGRLFIHLLFHCGVQLKIVFWVTIIWTSIVTVAWFSIACVWLDVFTMCVMAWVGYLMFQLGWAMYKKTISSHPAFRGAPRA